MLSVLRRKTIQSIVILLKLKNCELKILVLEVYAPCQLVLCAVLKEFFRSSKSSFVRSKSSFVRQRVLSYVLKEFFVPIAVLHKNTHPRVTQEISSVLVSGLRGLKPQNSYSTAYHYRLLCPNQSTIIENKFLLCLCSSDTSRPRRVE